MGEDFVCGEICPVFLISHVPDGSYVCGCQVLCFIAMRRVCVTVSMQNDSDGSGAVNAADFFREHTPTVLLF